MADTDRALAVATGQDELWPRARRRDAVAGIGSILGEDGGSDAATLDQQRG